MSILRTAKDALFGISLLSIASIINAALAFALQVILVRIFAPHDYGIFVASFASVALLAPLAGIGVAQFWLKVFSEDPVRARKYLKSSYALMALMTALTFCLLLGWSYAQPQDSQMRVTLQILSACILGHLAVDLLNTKYQHEKKILLLAAVLLAQNSLRLGLIGGIFLILGPETMLVHIAMSYALSAGVIFSFGLFAFKSFAGSHLWIRFPERAGLDFVSVGIRKVLKGSSPFGIAIFLQLIYYQSDVIMLKFLSTPAQVGYYNVAFVLVSATYILPTVVFHRYFLPKIHIWAKQDAAKLSDFSRFFSVAIGLAGLLVAVIFWSISDPLVRALFGEDYAPSVIMLRILSLSIPAIYISYNFGAILMTGNNMKNKTIILAVVALFNIVANVVFIPKWGAEGAATTTLMSAVLLVALYTIGARKVLRQLRSAASASKV